MTERRRPTEAELEILSILWDQAPATVRQVHDRLGADGKDVGYTTVLKLMQIMADKGLVEREPSGRTHLYRPASRRRDTQRRLVGDLMDKAFAGSAGQLALRALSMRPSSPEEIEAIRELLDDLEAKESK